LWLAYGPGRIDHQEADAKQGSALVLSWEDAKTRLLLRLPYTDAEGPEFLAVDKRGPEAAAARAAAALVFDRAERKARLEANEPHLRLPRWLVTDAVALGGERDRAVAALARLRGRQLPVNEGVSVLLEEAPPAGAPHWARQLFVRFANGKVVEIRARYQEGLAPATPAVPALPDLLQRICGAPERRPSPWAGLWPELPGPAASPLLRWVDDRSVLTYQADAGGSEVVLRERPLDQPEGEHLPPLQFVSHGVEGCQVGDRRADVLRHWKSGQPMPREDGSVLLPLPPGSPFDVLVAYGADGPDGKVNRILARHRAAPTPKDVTPDLEKIWGRDWKQLGLVRRVESASGRLQGWGWHDDRVRVRTFVADTEHGPCLFTEWREWPVPLPRVAARP
jgi:hypothetical protein